MTDVTRLLWEHVMPRARFRDGAQVGTPAGFNDESMYIKREGILHYCPKSPTKWAVMWMRMRMRMRMRMLLLLLLLLTFSECSSLFGTACNKFPYIHAEITDTKREEMVSWCNSHCYMHMVVNWFVLCASKLNYDITDMMPGQFPLLMPCVIQRFTASCISLRVL